MVSAMASAYDGLTDEERERVFFLAVGKNDFTNWDSNFCQGFAACADDGGDPWWKSWQSAQRDVFFYIKSDPNDNDSWEYYCRYSMNTGRDQFDDTVREMLELVDANAADYEELQEADAFGNNTVMEPEISSNALSPTVPVPVMTDSIAVSSAGSISIGIVQIPLLVSAIISMFLVL